MLTRCLVVHANGRTETVVWKQSEIAARLGGSLTFVGTVDALDVVMVALEEPDSSLARHVWSESPRLFEDVGVVRGPIVCVGTSADGEPVDVDVEALRAWCGE